MVRTFFNILVTGKKMTTNANGDCDTFENEKSQIRFLPISHEILNGEEWFLAASKIYTKEI